LGTYYWRITGTRGGGSRGDICIDSTDLLGDTNPPTPEPTTAPTNLGDTNPPTAAPSNTPTSLPTAAPLPAYQCARFTSITLRGDSDIVQVSGLQVQPV
jgi:hypothetical protein